jgi:asparagine synthase (glutamine-hydrolysing)
VEAYNQLEASLKSILTLRYDNTIEPLLKKLTWDDFVERNSTNEVDTVEQFLTNNIKKQISGSKKVVLALSGGVDSSLMLALVRKTFPEIDIVTISVIFADSFDESKEAQKLAERFEAEHQIVHVDNYLEHLPNAISIIKRPFWDLHWYTIVKEASNISYSLISGDGGDELFGGYTFRYEKFLSLTNSSSTPLEKIKAYLQCHERDWVPDQEKIFGKKISFKWDDIYSTLYPYFDNPLSPLAQVFLTDYNGKLLYNFSPLNSAFHRFFGVKPITPLLVEDLISYASHLSLDLKYDKQSNFGKILLRKILAKNLPDSISLTKRGFSVDTVNLWKSKGYKICDHYLSDSRIANEGWVDKEWMKSHMKKDLDVRYVNKFLGLLAVEIWFRLFITKEVTPDTKLD